MCMYECVHVSLYLCQVECMRTSAASLRELQMGLMSEDCIGAGFSRINSAWRSKLSCFRKPLHTYIQYIHTYSTYIPLQQQENASNHAPERRPINRKKNENSNTITQHVMHYMAYQLRPELIQRSLPRSGRLRTKKHIFFQLERNIYD